MGRGIPESGRVSGAYKNGGQVSILPAVDSDPLISIDQTLAVTPAVSSSMAVVTDFGRSIG